MKRLALAVSGSFILASGGALAQSYTVTDLGSLGGGYSTAYGINDLGQVVGASSTPLNNVSYTYSAFLYSGGTMTNLGTLGGAWSVARGINNAGQIVSQFENGNPNGTGGFYYSNGQMSDLGSLGGGRTAAYGINQAGQSVGLSFTDGIAPAYNAFIADGGGMTSLADSSAVLATDSTATAINDAGQIVGYYRTDFSGSPTKAFLFDNGVTTDLGNLGGSSSLGGFAVAWAINNAGQVVGDTYDSAMSAFVPYLYSNGSMKSLGSLGGTSGGAYGINDDGYVVGTSLLGPGVGHAFLYKDGLMYDLNAMIDRTLGWTLFSAAAINKFGQIAGTGFIGAKTHAFLLTPSLAPTPTPTPAVPEPETSAILLVGLGALGAVVRRRRRNAA